MNLDVRLGLIAPNMIDENEYKNKDRKSLPLGVYALEAYLKQYYNDIYIFDMVTNDLSNEYVFSQINSLNCNVIGISGMTNKHFESVIQLAKDIRNRCPSTKYLFVGGPLATFCSEVLLQDRNIDFTVIGEGEYILQNIVEALQNGKDIYDLKGVAYKRNGKIIVNEFEKRISNLSLLPTPQYNFTKRTIAEFISGSRAYVIMASRGCVGECYFCQVPYYYGDRGIYWRNVSSVVDEIEIAINKWGVKRFNFQDSNFLANKKWLNEFIDKVKQRNLKFLFNIFANVDNVDDIILTKLKEIGLFQVFVGFETGSEERYIRLKKTAKFDENNQKINILKKHNIKIIPGFILYYPDSSIYEIKESVEWFQKNNLIKPSMYFNKMDLWYGTPEYNRMKKKDKVVGHSISTGLQYEFEDEKVEQIYFLMLKGLEKIKILWYQISDLNYRIRKVIDDVIYDKLVKNETTDFEELRSIVDQVRGEMKQFDNGRSKSNEKALNSIISSYFGKVICYVEKEESLEEDLDNYLNGLIDIYSKQCDFIDTNIFKEGIYERFTNN